jgi:hypothetical protein
VQLVVRLSDVGAAALFGFLGRPEQDPEYGAGTLLSLGGGKGFPEPGWLVSVPDLVADDLFVGSDVASEFGLGQGQVFVLVFQHSVVFRLLVSAVNSWRLGDEIRIPRLLILQQPKTRWLKNAVNKKALGLVLRKAGQGICAEGQQPGIEPVPSTGDSTSRSACSETFQG